MMKNDIYEITDFEPSNTTIIIGSNNIVPNILFRLCVESVVYLDRDVLFVDGWNSFNPYTLARISKLFGEKPKNVLQRVHVARAFTEYQMEELIGRLRVVIDEWNPALLAISYMSSLFEDKRLFENLLNSIKSLTKSSDIITIMTSFGELEFDKLLLKNADRVIKIEFFQNIIRIIEDGKIFEYLPVSPGQVRLPLKGGDYIEDLNED